MSFGAFARGVVICSCNILLHRTWKLCPFVEAVFCLEVAASASPAVPVKELLCSLVICTLSSSTISFDGDWDELVELVLLPMAEGFTDRALRESDLCDFD